MTDDLGDRPSSTGVPRHGRWSRLCLKELRETLRDRRTLITLILMPLLVYPVLSMVFQRSLISTFTSQQPKTVVGVHSEKTAAFFRDQLSMAEEYLEQEESITRSIAESVKKESSETSMEKVDETSDSADAAAALPLLNATNNKLDVDNLIFREVADLEAEVAAERIDVGVLVPQETPTGHFQLIFRPSSSLSQRALRFIEERLLALNEIVLRQKLASLGHSPDIAVRVIRQPLVTESKEASALSTIVPMILILMTVTGAVYPAIDLTAGERERGTLEMLMASPVPRFRLLLAKYVAVVAVAFLTALVNLTAMMITLWATGLSETLLGTGGLNLKLVAQILALLVLFAAFFSAVLLSLTSFARSFKEAQAYLIPLMLLSLGPGIVSLLPGLQLNGLLAITPISNIVLLARDLCSGSVNPAMATAAILSTGLYTLAALGVAAKIFGTDAVMSGSNASFQTLFRDEANGRTGTERRVATVGGAMLCLAVLFPIYFIVLNGLAKLDMLSMTSRLVLAGVSTSFLFGVIPWTYAKLQRLDLQYSFQTFRAPMVGFTVAVMLGFTVWPLAHEAVLLMQSLKIAVLSEDQMKAAAGLLEQLRTVHPALIFCSMALAPAIFEELFFRGYLFSALKAATNATTTILASAILFGVFHVVSSNALSVERLLPSTIMGLILGYLCYRSESVLPGIVLHACHNGLLTMMAYYKDELAAAGWGMDEQSHIPTRFLLASFGTLITGLVLIYFIPTNHYVGREADGRGWIEEQN